MWICVHIRGIVSAADILFTPSVQRVLAATLAHPERAYTLQELLAVAGKCPIHKLMTAVTTEITTVLA